MKEEEQSFLSTLDNGMRLLDQLAEKAKDFAKIAHQALCCSDYSRTDMILSGEDLFVLETNTIPGMTPTSLLPQSVVLRYG